MHARYAIGFLKLMCHVSYLSLYRLAGAAYSSSIPV